MTNQFGDATNRGDAMSEIARFFSWDGDGMRPANNGDYVRYDDHRAEVERLKEQVAALTLAVEQADEMKAHAEAAAAAEEAETDRVTCERDVAQAEVQRLVQELGGRSATNQQIIAERDAARAEVERLREERDEAHSTIYRLAGERDQSNSEVKRLTFERDQAQTEVKNLNARMTDAIVRIRALTAAVEKANEAKADAEAAAAREEAETDRVKIERDAAQAEMARLRANPSASLTSSRPTDEDIWREAFMRQLHDDHVPNWATTADLALAEYRKRWPR